MIHIRDMVESDFERVVRLNDAEVQQTSQMDRDRLGLLVHLSSYCKVATVDGHVAAFLIALREGAPYQNDNYQWFAGRFPSFLYVDRIVVGADFSGRKIGSSLYGEMFEFARAHRVEAITCEYNIEPPNPASRAFHDRFGFKEVGRQWVAAGTKQVSLQAAMI
ncbi:GNAT family N-acetyltransferase [Lysobacter koreensis]|uniref:GNAT family N-acetyltransferase n=1 Tax=Lysobacter koreensis TaxID=266122 RepID=A0ABW2YQ32_9GAMM